MIRYDEACVLVSNISDLRTRYFVKYGLTSFLTRIQPTLPEGSNFDVYVLVETLRLIARDRESMITIFDGDPTSLEWWPEGDA